MQILRNLAGAPVRSLMVIGLAIAIVAVVPTNRPPVAATSPLPYQVVPFNNYVAGTGMTETGQGNVSIGTRLYLRVDIDENDAWRVRPATRGVAFVRGNPGVPIPLRFEYLEPYGTRKTSVTGQGSERTDLRVLQVVYSFEPTGSPVYLGQRMDAFIAVER